MPVLSTIEAQHNIAKEPQKHGNTKNQLLTAIQPRSEDCYSSLCPISELHDPVDLW